MAETPARTVVNFKESCVDPLAKLVMLEAMSFAVEKAESRLDALGKIFPGLADIGEPILQDIKDIRFAVENMNVCSIPGPAVVGTAPSPVSEPPPAAAIKQLPKREQELVKAMPENLQTALLMELSRKPGESAKAPDFFVKGQPVSATKEQKKSTEKAEEKVRTISPTWGTLEFKGLSYSTPGAFLDALHGVTGYSRKKSSQIKALEDDGFDVFIGDKLISSKMKKEELDALKGVGMRVEVKKGVIRPTPSGGVPIEKAPGEYPEPWVVVQDATGKMLFIEDARRVVIPENVWRKYTSDQLDKKAPFSRKAESKPAFESRIPGLPVSGVGKVGKVGSSE